MGEYGVLAEYLQTDSFLNHAVVMIAIYIYKDGKDDTINFI